MKGHIYVAALLGTSAVLAGSAAFGAQWWTCNGSPVIWRGTLNVQRQQCTIFSPAQTLDAYWNGVNQWNNLTSVVDNFLVRPASDCFFDDDDGINEVGLISRGLIDGANGSTALSLGACGIGSNDIDEADVMIANDLDFDNKVGNVLSNSGGRATFVHEFGHLFGFNHQDGSAPNLLAVMSTNSPHALTGGAATATVFPNDTFGFNTLYGLSSSLPNLMPSAMGANGTSAILLNTGLTATCPGLNTNVSFFLGNTGKSASGTYNMRIRMSTSSTPGAAGTTVATFTHSLAAFGTGVFSLPFTVPNLSPGDYFIHVDMDHTSSISEVREGDNSTVSGRKIRIDFCPL